MKRWLIVGGILVGAVLVARQCASRCGRIDIEQKIERMPDNAPRKWMFSNIGAIRENTNRILELLERESSITTDDAVRTAA